MTNTEILNFCLTEVELYMDEIFSANKDSVILLNLKADLLRTVAKTIKFHEETEGAEKYFEQIGKTIKGIRKVNGMSSFDSISNKIGMYTEHIDFLKEMRHY